MEKFLNHKDALKRMLARVLGTARFLMFSGRGDCEKGFFMALTHPWKARDEVRFRYLRLHAFSEKALRA